MKLSPKEVIEKIERAEDKELEAVFSNINIEDLWTALTSLRYSSSMSRKKFDMLASFARKRLISIYEATADTCLEEVLFHQVRAAADKADIRELERILGVARAIQEEVEAAWPGNVKEDRKNWSKLLKKRRLNEIRDRREQFKPASCPRCHGTKINRIMYGMPSSRVKLYEPDRSDVTLGGCIVSGANPKWHCTSCNWRWVEKDDPRYEEWRKEMIKVIEYLKSQNKDPGQE